MKKILTFLAFLAVACAPRWAAAEDVKRQPNDIVTFQYKGSTNVALGVSSGGVIYSEEGLVNVHETFPYLVTPSSTALLAVRVTTTSLSAGPTYFWATPTGIPQTITQPRSPYALWFQMNYAAAQSTSPFGATITVSGIDSVGSSRTLSLLLTTNPVITGAAFVYVSTIVVGVASSSGGISDTAYLSFGTTNQLGLANDIVSSGDVYAWYENGTIITSATVNALANMIQTQLPPSLASTTTISGLGPILYGNRYEAYYRARQSPPRRLFPNRTNITP